jgi:signal transduction histidine kinase
MPRSTRSTILFVDDELENLNLFNNLLKRHHRVVTCQKGDEALRLLEKERVAVMVCDQRMPDLNGIEVLTRAREISPDTVRILVTAYPDIDVTIEAINQGRVRRYLEKPWEPSELRALIAQSVEHYELTRHNQELVSALRERNQILEEQSATLTQRNAELKRLDNVKTELLTNVSHELRTPLVSIRGYTDLMRMGRMGDITAQQQRALDVIGVNVKRLVGLIEDLLDLSRLDHGNETLEQVPLDLAAVLDELTEALRARAEEAEVNLALHSGHQPLVVTGDRQRLEQAFANLLDNALKFNHPGGEVTVRTRSTTTGHIVIEVSDTGDGIPEPHLAHIFERFHQVDSSSTRRHGGTGIGLSLARQILHDHGGDIEVSSTEGSGSVFTVSLPASSKELPPVATNNTQDRQLPPAADPMPNKTSRNKVLVVDDDRDLLEYTAALLAFEKIGCYTALDAETALHLARTAEDIGLILLDIAMPITDGLSLCRTFKNSPETSAIPIYMVSARVGAKTVRQSLQSGADGYLVKPFETEEFLSIVRRAIGS